MICIVHPKVKKIWNVMALFGTLIQTHVISF